MRLVIIGNGDSGKDYAASYIASKSGLRNCGAVSLHMMPYVAEQMRMDPVKAYETRREHREEWAEIIDTYRHGDPACIIREMFKGGSIIAGVRRRDEFDCAKEEGLINLTLWIEADVPEDTTNHLTPHDADHMLFNDKDSVFKESLDYYIKNHLLTYDDARHTFNSR